MYIFEINPLSVASFAIIFSQSEGCLFTLLISPILRNPTSISYISNMSVSLWVVVQLPSHIQHDPIDCSTPGFPVHHHLL